MRDGHPAQEVRHPPMFKYFVNQDGGVVDQHLRPRLVDLGDGGPGLQTRVLRDGSISRQ